MNFYKVWDDEDDMLSLEAYLHVKEWPSWMTVNEWELIMIEWED